MAKDSNFDTMPPQWPGAFFVGINAIVFLL